MLGPSSSSLVAASSFHRNKPIMEKQNRRRETTGQYKGQRAAGAGRRIRSDPMSCMAIASSSYANSRNHDSDCGIVGSIWLMAAMLDGQIGDDLSSFFVCFFFQTRQTHELYNYCLNVVK